MSIKLSTTTTTIFFTCCFAFCGSSQPLCDAGKSSLPNTGLYGLMDAERGFSGREAEVVR